MSGSVQYAGRQTPEIKTVYYNGSDTLLNGYCLCYDESATVDATDPALTLGTLVEKPVTASLYAFAGIVTNVESGGRAGPGYYEIIVPRRGVITEAFCDIDTVKGSTALGVANNSYGLTTPSDDEFNELFVATAMETDATLTATSANTLVYLR